MNVRTVITTWLRANGYDGLATDGCGCSIDDLAPCDGCDILDSCSPARKHPCDGPHAGCACDQPSSACYQAAAAPAEPEETHS